MYLDELYYDALDLLRALVATPRLSGQEAAAADVLAGWLEGHGLRPERLHDNVFCPVGQWQPGVPVLLLNSHLDTVPACQGWATDPWQPVEDEAGRITGLGSNDAGASLVTLAAVSAYFNAQPPGACGYNLLFAASAQEEVSGPQGMQALVEVLQQRFGPVALAVVGEPTAMLPATAERGLMVLDVAVKGRAGHAARSEGVNAIYRAMEVVQLLRTLEPAPRHPALGAVGINVTAIHGGQKHNVVPDLCTLTVDVRTVPTATNAQVLQAIQGALPPWATATARSTRLAPSATPPGCPFVQRLELLGRKGFASLTLSDQALMPWPSVKIGPGDSARSHCAGEYVMAGEIREALEIFIRVLTGLQP